MASAVALFVVGFGVLAAGVLIGRYYVPDDRALKRAARHARSYLRALNHLLARNRDAAVDELRRVVDEDVSDVEPYFALGALFRRRGEWERAVRVHQALELRADADKQTRLRALYELGLDFRAAGMPRRATRAMEQCLDLDARHEGALRALCGLYEEQRYYVEAAGAWSRLEKLRGGERSPREPHLWAAAAEVAIAAGDLDAARGHLDRTARYGAELTHVLAVSASLDAALGNPRGASERLVRALAGAPELAALLVPAIEVVEGEQLRGEAGGAADPGDVHRLAAERAGQLVDDVIAAVGPHVQLVLARARLRAASDIDGALAELRGLLEHEPDLLAARVTAARLVLALGDPGAAQRELASLVAAGGPLARLGEGLWHCVECGRLGREFSWRCDDCRHWGTARYDLDGARIRRLGPPRERRAAPRTNTGASPAPAALPPTGDPGDDPEQGSANALARAGAWISDAWQGMRGRRRSSPPTDPTPSGE